MNNNKRIFSSAIVIALSMCFLLYKYLLQIFPTVMTDQLRQHYHLSGFGLGNLAACFFYSYFVIQLLAGPILDKFSLKFISALTLLLAAVGAFMFASAPNIDIAYLGRALMGIGAAFATVSYMKMAANYFAAKNFAFIGGLLTVGVMLGALFAQAPMAALTNKVGWQQAVHIIAIAGLVLACGYLFFPRPTYNVNQKRVALIAGLKQILSKRTNWYLMCYSGLAFAPLAVFGGLWGTPFLKTLEHISTVRAGALISLIYVGFGIGGPIFGYTARIYNIFHNMLLGLLVSGICMCLFIYGPWHNTFIDASLLIIFGMGTGAFMLGFVVGKDMNHILLAASVIAIINTGDALLGAITEPLIGKLLDIFSPVAPHSTASFSLHSYHLALGVLPIYLVLAVLFLKLVQRSSE